MLIIVADIDRCRFVAFAIMLRPSNTGNIFLQLVVQQRCRCKLRFFVARKTTFSRSKFSCCRKKMSLLLSATQKFVAREGGNTRNKQSQLATQHCCATSCTKMLPVLLGLYSLKQESCALTVLYFNVEPENSLETYC